MLQYYYTNLAVNCCLFVFRVSLDIFAESEFYIFTKCSDITVRCNL